MTTPTSGLAPPPPTTPDITNTIIPTQDDFSECTHQTTSSQPLSLKHRISRLLHYQPPATKWDPTTPPKFTLKLNILFAFAGCFTVANLYYSHPILNVLATDFSVSYEKVSQIPTLAQAGYAIGLLLLNPCGDIFRRRRFVLCLVAFTAALWVGLCVTGSFEVFSAISFITAITTVTPQLMLPLVGDLAPPHRRASALSIVTAGNLLGILIARLLSGIVTEFTSWRTIYWVAFGLQWLILVLLWAFMPDYPSTNPGGLNYFRMMWDMARMLKTYPVLVQACVVGFCNSAPFTSYWTTLTFLLADRYHYSSVVIGLFALIGIAGIVVTPLFSRVVIDKFVPLFSVLLGEVISLTGIVIGTYTGLYSVAGPCIQAFALDMGLQISQIANRSAIYSCAPTARNRINTVYMLATFLGQITGTSAGNKLYAQGGWVSSGSLSVAFVGFTFFVVATRGPWEKGWVGWGGGWSIRKKDHLSADGKTADKAMHGRSETPSPVGEEQDIEATEPRTQTEKALEESAGEDGEDPMRRGNDEKEARR